MLTAGLNLTISFPFRLFPRCCVHVPLSRFQPSTAPLTWAHTLLPHQWGLRPLNTYADTAHVLEHDVDGSLVAVARAATEDQIAHGFFQARREEGFFAVFQGIIVQDGREPGGQKAFQKTPHDGTVAEPGSGQQIMGRIEVLSLSMPSK